jgi:hypothetical protein
LQFRGIQDDISSQAVVAQVYCIDNIDLSSFHLSIQGQKKLCVRPVPVAQSYASCRQW